MRTKLISILGVLAFAGIAKPAQAADRTLELAPPKTRPSNGSGYSSVEQEFKPQVCVTFGEEREDGQGGGSDDVWKSISSNSELADEMALGVQVGFKVAMGVASASVDTKVDFLSKTQTNFTSQTILATHKSLDAPKFIKGDIKLKEEFKKLKGSEFKAKCGEFMVLGMQEGSEFFGTVQFEIRDSSAMTDFSTATKASGSYGPYSANAAFDYAKKSSNKSKLTNLTVHAITSGGNLPMTTIEDFEREYKAYPTKAKKSIIKIIAVPYEDIVADWPTGNPLAPMTADEKLDKLTEVAFAHVSLITDTKFITRSKELFALGTSENNRKAKLGAVENLVSVYEKQLDDLRKNAKGCENDFNSKCEALYTKWEKWDAASEYDKLPQRYTSDCSGVTLKGDTWGMKLQSIDVRKNKGKDLEFGNNPVKLTANLDLSPKGKELLATMSIKLAEVGKEGFGHINEDTSFSGSDNATVYTLEKDPMGNDMSRCSFGKPPFVGKLVEGHAGHLEESTGKKPDDSHKFTKGEGLIRKMTCVIGAKGKKNEKGALSCSNIVFADLKLNLLSEQDTAADDGKSSGSGAAAHKKARDKAKSAKNTSKPKRKKSGQGK